jgi:enoyl-CoA hydratase
VIARLDCSREPMDKPNTNLSMRRRELLKFAAVAASTLAIAESSRSAESDGQAEVLDVRLPAEPAGGAQDLVTTERRGQILLIGLNRQAAENRLNPASYAALAKAYYTFDKDPTLRAAILFGHGKSFCAGIDAEAFAPIYSAGSTSAAAPQTIDPFGKIKPRLSKPLVVVAHGNTFNAGHEIFLAADIRLAAVDTKFGQMENTQARIPGGGATVRFVHEAGWGNAMRYMLTGDSWTATEAKRMGTLQEICPTRDDAILLALQIASRIAACGPLSIKTTLASAHTSLDVNEDVALSELNGLRTEIYRTKDAKEALTAQAEHRLPTFEGK